MKNTYKLAGLFLLATITTGFALPTAAKAATDVAGAGKITFEQDLSTLPDNLLPGQPDGPILTGPDQNVDPSALKIISVTDLNFDVHKIAVNDSNKTYKTLPFTTKDTEGNDVTTAHFVRFQDVRTNVAENHYTLSAKMTKQFTDETNDATLNGATLAYKNISLVSGTNNTTLPSPATISATTQTLALNSTQNFVVNNEIGKGFGIFELMFDTNENASAGTYDGVTLNIPGTNKLTAGDYQGEVTWSIADVN